MMKECIPTIIALTLTGLYSVIDGLFIGLAAGDIGLAAINLAWPISAFITAAGLGVGTGGSVRYSNARGRGEAAEGEKILWMTLALLAAGAVIVTGILLAVYGRVLHVLGAAWEVYIQAEAYSRVIIVGSIFQIGGAGMVPILRNLSLPFSAMGAMVCGMLANLGLNYLFILRLGMGIRGAALGTVCAQMVVCLICLYEIRRIKNAGSGKRNPVDTANKARLADVGNILKTGLPAFGMSLAPTVVLMFTNRQCLRLGGTQAVAAYAVISYIVFPVQSLLQGVGDGLQPLMSYYVGAGEKKRLQKLTRYAYGMIAGIGGAAFLAALACRKQIGGWFHLSGGAGDILQTGFVISAVSFLFYGFVRFHVAYMNSRLMLKTAGILIYGECLIVAPMFIVGLPKVLGMPGVWCSLPATGLCMLIVYAGIRRSVR